MTLLKATTVALALAIPLFAVAKPGHATEGQAAYHLHTDAMVTAARYEPRGSVLRVTNPRNGRSVVVTVNDRGPFNGNRILDLSTGAFSSLFGGLGRGVGPITYEVISRPEGGELLSGRGGSPRMRRSSPHKRRRTSRSYYRRRR